MKIDLNNYEECFLMYADNELSASDRICVENFVIENASLADEFELIKAAVLQPEEIYLTNKNELKKSIELEITAHDQRLNLYLDNELSIKEKEQFEKELDANREMVNELNIFKRAINVPDYSVVFPNKEKLHRHEKKVIPLYLTRLAAAAIILGAGIWVGSLFVARTEVPGNSQVANSEILPKKAPSFDNPVTQHETVVPSVVHEQQSDKSNDEAGTSDLLVAKREQKEDHQLAATITTPPANDNVDKDITNSIIAPEKAASDMITQQLAVAEPPIKTQDEPLKMSMVNNSNFKPVSYVEQDLNNDDEDKNFPQKEFRKSKLGVFLKKASRTLTRNLKGSTND